MQKYFAKSKVGSRGCVKMIPYFNSAYFFLIVYNIVYLHNLY
jgi:hypothetical protein